MYRKRTRTTQENTGNSKKRRLKYELYDSRFHKSYDNIKTGGYDDYSVVMDGGANTTVPPTTAPPGDNSNRKVIFYDEKDEVDAFINKWFETPKNLNNGNNKLDLTKLTSKFKSTFTDSDNKYDKLLAKLFNKFIEHKHTNSDIQNINYENIFNQDYITPILDQLNNENNNTVAVFEYDLFLYNLDTILKKYKTNEKFTKFFDNNDEDNMFIKHIKNAKNQFGVNAIIEDVKNDKDVYSGKKMKMYIPKLLTKSKSFIDALVVNGGANTQPQPQPYDIKKLKKLENSNKTKTPQEKKIRRITEDVLWETVLNNKKSHYGFEGDTPKNLMTSEFTLSNDKDKIELYFKKCNDLQQLYINKHIELLDIFKKMNEYINLNDTINDVIKKLVDPKYFNSKGKDGKLKLPKPEITELKELLKTQTMVKKVVEDLNEEKTGGGNGEIEGEEARQTTDRSKKDLKNKYIVDELVDYEFLQLIKQIQLSNETSIKHILGIKNNGKTKLDTLIAEYQNHINEKSYEKKKHNKTKDTWQSFNINNTNNLYFNNSNTLGETSSDPDTIQKVIYKCYDLQILYLVKHIEVIEMFKLVYYYYDMMIKKIGILFFILSLYHKSDIDFTDVVIHLPLGKANIKEMLAKQTSLQQATQSGGAGADTKEEIIAKLKTEIEKYNKENSKYENTKTDYKKKAIEKIELLLTTTTTPHLKLFNHLLTYFKAFSDYIDVNKDNIKNYDYIDKLLIKLLKTILPDIAETKNEGEYNKEEAKQIFNVVKNIYFDIIEQEINIQHKQDNVKKERSSYGVVKIGQFSKMDYDISQTIAKNFEKIFEYRIKDEIDYSKDSYKNYTQQYKTLDTLTELLVNARSLLKEQTPEKKAKAKEVIKNIEKSMEELFNSVEGDATITTVANEEGTLVGGASSKLKYISEAINANKDFGEGDIPDIYTNKNNDPEHIRTSLFEEYRLNFLELLKNVYFPKEKVDLKNMDIDTELVLLTGVLDRVRYKKQPIEGENDKSNVIYIKQSAFYVLKTQENRLIKKKKDDEAELLAKLEAERLEAERLEAERLEAERKEAERRAEEAERQRLEAERLAEEARQAKTAENADTKKEKQSILDKITYMIDLYNTKQEDETINNDLKELSTKIENNEKYPDNGLTLLTAENWWQNRKMVEQITDEDINIYNIHYSQLLSILQGSALIYVNLKPKQGGSAKQGGAAKQEMFDVNYDTKQLTFNNLCKDKDKDKERKHGPYELVFPEATNKNNKLYQTLFDSNENEPRTVNFTVEEGTNTELQKQGLMTSIDNSKSVVLFGFGFSGSGKTYTLIEGGTGDTSILYKFIDKNKEQINSVEFLEIYPDPDKPTFFVGTGKEQELKGIINSDKKNNEIKEDKKYNTITKEELTTIEARIAKIEKYRREQLRILPTPNNPNSSRSFLQITIKMATGGQLVIFDMPGTESTVRIKEMMLGKKSYVDNTKLRECNDFNKDKIQDCFKFNKNALKYFIQEGVSINFEKSTLNQTICKELYKYLTYKNEYNQSTQSNKSCAISNLFEGFDTTIINDYLSQIDTNISIKYTKQYDNSYIISSVQAILNEDTTKEIMNIVFKYFILNIFKFNALGITFSISNSTGIKQTKKDDREKKAKYIAKIGFELACFFNKKAYSTYDDYFQQTQFAELVFLKDDDYKKIYDQFLSVILIDDNFSKSDSDISLETNINDKENKMDEINKQKQKMMEVFEFTTITTPSNKSNTSKPEVQVEFKDEIFTQSLENIKKINPNFLNTEKTHAKSIFIKYILFILSYIKEKSKKLKTKVFGEIGEIDKEKVKEKTYEQFTSVTLEELTKLYDEYNTNLTPHLEKEKKIKELNKQIDDITKNLNIANKTTTQYQNLKKTDKSASIRTIGNQTVLKLTKLYKSLNNSSIPSITETSKKEDILQTLPQVITNLETKLATLNTELTILNQPITETEKTQMNQSKINYISAKAIYDIENMRLRASVYFIYKYIKFIVNQGSGIMTTLEHLKFFFLSRAGKIEKYNNNHESDKQKQFTIEGDKDIFNKEETYTNKEGEIEEKINIGEMEKYGLISILQSLAGDETNLKAISEKEKLNRNIPNLLTPKQSVAQSAEQPKNTTKSKFIMLAHINPFPNTNEDEEKQKKCKSASDTLAYIDSISANNLGVLTRGGGYRKKKYYKDINSSLLPTLKQHRIKRFTTLKKLNKNKKNLFTSKTKKLL